LSNSGTAEVLIPRSLCLIEDVDNLIIDAEDLCSVSISWEDGFVSELKPLKNKVTKPKNILFPRFVETHSHFDKSFTFGEFPNFKSNYQEAIAVNLEEHKTRTKNKVLNRAENLLTLLFKMVIEPLEVILIPTKLRIIVFGMSFLSYKKNILLSWNYNM